MAFEPYAILGLEVGASKEEIRAAYRKMASRHHPDKSPDDPYAKTKFQQIKEAYEILSDPERLARLNRGESTKKRDMRGASSSLLVTIFMDILRSQGDRHVIANMIKELDNRKHQANSGERKITKESEKIASAKERFSYDGSGENLFYQVIDAEHKKMVDTIQMIKLDLETIMYARAMLEDYKDTDPLELPAAFGQVGFHPPTFGARGTGGWEA